MTRTFLGAAATAAIVLAVAPAQAERLGIGCSGPDLTKTESAVELMADGPAKVMAQGEIAAAQDAMLKGSMRKCADHLGRAARADTMSQHPNLYLGTMAQESGQEPGQEPAHAPADIRRQAPPPAWTWQPLTPAL